MNVVIYEHIYNFCHLRRFEGGSLCKWQWQKQGSNHETDCHLHMVWGRIVG